MTGQIVACAWGDAAAAAGELLTLARRLAGALSTSACWLVLGPAQGEPAEAASRFGAAAVHLVPHREPEACGGDAHVEALAQYCKRAQPAALLFSQTFDVRTVAPRLAGRLGCAVVMNALDAAPGEDGVLRVTVSAYGGDTHAVYDVGGPAPRIIALMPNAVSPEPPGTPSTPTVEEIEVDLDGITERVRIVEAAAASGPRLEDAQVIVAGGRGLGQAENFRLIEELARALGGMPAASRPIVDEGWVDASRQVGLTGKITRPALYIAAGISGASQHMAGCAAAKTIVAINRDQDAAIFRYARFGAVGDCLEILPEIVRELER